MHSYGDHGQWAIQVSGKLSTSQKQVSRVISVRLLSILAFAVLLVYICQHVQMFGRFGEGYIITVRIQGDLPNLEPLYQFFSDKFPRATLKVRNSVD